MPWNQRFPDLRRDYYDPFDHLKADGNPATRATRNCYFDWHAGRATGCLMEMLG